MKLKEKNNILMNLANHTEKSVLMPENPVTLDNPDGIYLYRGRIFALFIPTSAERSNYDHLLRRLYVSQLSYSSDLVTILLLDADDRVGGDGEFIFHKSFCHVSRSFDDVLRYIAGVGDINRDWGIIKEHRSIQYQICDAKRLHFLSFFDYGDDLRWGHDFRCDGEMFEVACHKK